MAFLSPNAPIASMHGTIQKIGNIRYVVKHYQSGKIGFYMQPVTKRKTKPSAAEIERRKQFAQINAVVRQREADGDNRPHKIIWHEVASTLFPET